MITLVTRVTCANGYAKRQKYCAQETFSIMLLLTNKPLECRTGINAKCVYVCVFVSIKRQIEGNKQTVALYCLIFLLVEPLDIILNAMFDLLTTVLLTIKILRNDMQFTFETINYYEIEGTVYFLTASSYSNKKRTTFNADNHNSATTTYLNAHEPFSVSTLTTSYFKRNLTLSLLLNMKWLGDILKMVRGHRYVLEAP
jgi:hypothetical protein